MKKEQVVQIEINDSVIDRMKKENIVMDLMGTTMLILKALFEDKPELLDHADDSNKERRMNVLYMQLTRRGLLERDAESVCHYKLTPRGNELITYLMEQQVTEIKAEGLVPISEIELESCEGWIHEYVSIFPDVPDGERPIRMHVHTAINKMNAFIKRFKYTKETILAATRAYIDYQEQDGEGHKYTINSNNFISKNPSRYANYESALATWCQRWLDTQRGDRPQQFDTRGLEMV